MTSIRGGDQKPSKHRKKRSGKDKSKRKSSSRSTSRSADEKKQDKDEISKAIHKDSATMMGDAIRARSLELLEDDISQAHLRGRHGNVGSTGTMFTSLSYGIGTSDDRNTESTISGENQQESPHMDEGGGVEVNPSAVIANYFLKSHGGVHGIQSLTSLLSVLFGLATYLTPISADGGGADVGKIGLKVRLLQRTLLCALCKHLSGFLAVATMSAGSIPDVGWRETRKRIEALALDPVAQYLFYCALLIVWADGDFSDGIALTGASKAATYASTVADAAKTVIPWWLTGGKKRLICTTCILAPILLREIMSTIWVISDVIVLYHSARRAEDTPSILKKGQCVVDAAMSLLLTSSEWRNATAAQKQNMLAKSVSKLSLGFELGTTTIIVYDAVKAFINFSVSPVGSPLRPGVMELAKKMFCARLMINFMLVRRKKVLSFVYDVRGGAIQVPGRVLDFLLEPSKSLGIGSNRE